MTDLRVVNIAKPEVKELSTEINKVVASLNNLIQLAAEAGLKVELDLREEQTFGSRHPKPLIDIQLYGKV